MGAVPAPWACAARPYALSPYGNKRLSRLSCFAGIPLLRRGAREAGGVVLQIFQNLMNPAKPPRHLPRLRRVAATPPKEGNITTKAAYPALCMAILRLSLRRRPQPPRGIAPVPRVGETKNTFISCTSINERRTRPGHSCSGQRCSRCCARCSAPNWPTSQSSPDRKIARNGAPRRFDILPCYIQGTVHKCMWARWHINSAIARESGEDV